MNRKVARYGLWFYLLTFFVAIIFPKKVFGNIYILLAYLVVALLFIYFIYFKKVKS